MFLRSFASVSSAVLFAAAPLALAPLAVRAADTMPAGGETLVRLNPADFKANTSERGTTKIVPVGGPGFDKAVEVVSQKRGNPWEVQFQNPVPKPLKKGEVLLVHVWARTLKTQAETGVGTMEVTVQKNSPGYDSSIGRSVSVPTKWTEFYFRGVSKDNYPAGTMTFDFRCGAGEQTLQIGGAELISYGNRVPVADLPYTKATYVGRELTAPWRTEAEARIKKYRTTPFVVVLKDRAGKPVSGADVRVSMTRNAFGFGAAVQTERLISPSPENLVYQKMLLENFNSASFVNALKWPAWIGEWGDGLSRSNTMNALKWVGAHNLDFRGHVLVWPSWRNLPQKMRPFETKPDKETALAAVTNHIKDEVTATRGQVAEWDVINEPFDNHDLMDAYGKSIMVDWFNDAHRAAPNARLTLNDYSILTSQDDTAHEQHFEDTARFLLDNKAPLSVLGMQGHFGNTPPTPTRVFDLLNRYAKLGPKIRITEYTMDTEDEDLRADWTRDFLTVLYSHPDVIGFQCWTPQDLFDIKTGQPKPAGRAYQKLVERWHTDVTEKSDKTGTIKGVGYVGTYQVTATKNGKTVRKTVLLTPGAKTVSLVLPSEP